MLKKIYTFSDWLPKESWFQYRKAGQGQWQMLYFKQFYDKTLFTLYKEAENDI